MPKMKQNKGQHTIRFDQQRQQRTCMLSDAVRKAYLLSRLVLSGRGLGSSLGGFRSSLGSRGLLSGNFRSGLDRCNLRGRCRLDSGSRLGGRSLFRDGGLSSRLGRGSLSNKQRNNTDEHRQNETQTKGRSGRNVPRPQSSPSWATWGPCPSEERAASGGKSDSWASWAQQPSPQQEQPIARRESDAKVRLNVWLKTQG